MEVAAIQWLLVVLGLEVVFISENNVNHLVLNLNPTQGGTDLDGVVFKCVAVDSVGVRYQEFITISVEGVKTWGKEGGGVCI